MHRQAIARKIRDIIVIALAMLSVSCQKTPNVKSQNANGYDIIRLANTLVDGAFIAEEEGFFKENHIKIQWTGKQAHGPAAIVSLVAGQNDAAGSISTAMILAIAQGTKLKIVAAQTKSSDSLPLYRYLVQDKSAITGKAGDFVGKKEVASPTTIAWYPLVVYLKRHGVDYRQVNFITLPSPLANEQAIRQGEVDIIGGSEITPPASKLLSEGGFRFLDTITDFGILKIPQIGGWAMREDFIKKNPDLTRRFVASLAKAYDWSNAHPDSAQRILNRRNEIPAAYLEYQKIWRPVPSSALVDGESIRKWIDILVEFGQLDSGKVRAEEVYDNSFNPSYKP
jgi:sulfonate transport system substrate-binding protein